jgi:uncharacterized membrane protein YbaN (DUF454 family)
VASLDSGTQWIAASELVAWILTVVGTIFAAVVIGVPLFRLVRTIRRQPESKRMPKKARIFVLVDLALSVGLLVWAITTDRLLVGVLVLLVVGYMLPTIVILVARLRSAKD